MTDDSSRPSLIGPILLSFLGLGLSGWGFLILFVIASNWDRIQDSVRANGSWEINGTFFGAGILLVVGLPMLSTGLKRVSARMKS